MRKPTPEQLKVKQILLSRLRDDWVQISRPHINRDLRNSLHTRILELEAEIRGMEARLRTPRRAPQAQPGAAA
jgi:hypothetical protein